MQGLGPRHVSAGRNGHHRFQHGRREAPAAALILDRLAEGPETQLALANYRGQGHAFKVLNQLVARGEVVAATVRGRTVYTLPARG